MARQQTWSQLGHLESKKETLNTCERCVSELPSNTFSLLFMFWFCHVCLPIFYRPISTTIYFHYLLGTSLTPLLLPQTPAPISLPYSCFIFCCSLGLQLSKACSHFPCSVLAWHQGAQDNQLLCPIMLGNCCPGLEHAQCCMGLARGASGSWGTLDPSENLITNSSARI